MLKKISRRFIFVLTVHVLELSALANPVDLHCCIVRSEGDELSNPTTISQISNELVEVNRVFRQVAMSFRLESCVYTNDYALSSIVETNAAQLVDLMSILDCGEGLNLYFVPRIIGDGCAFHTEFGIVFDRSFTFREIAHELGHACGLGDIYDWRAESDVVIDGELRKSWLPDDWGRYKTVYTQDEILKGLLMYGYSGNRGVDITYGDVHGLWYTVEQIPGHDRKLKVWHQSLAPVGFHLHGNRHPHTTEW